MLWRKEEHTLINVKVSGSLTNKISCKKVVCWLSLSIYMVWMSLWLPALMVSVSY